MIKWQMAFVLFISNENDVAFVHHLVSEFLLENYMHIHSIPNRVLRIAYLCDGFYQNYTIKSNAIRMNRWNLFDGNSKFIFLFAHQTIFLRWIPVQRAFADGFGLMVHLWQSYHLS